VKAAVLSVLLAVGSAGCGLPALRQESPTDPPTDGGPPVTEAEGEAEARPEPLRKPVPQQLGDCPNPPAVQYDGKRFSATFCGAGGKWAGATVRRAADSAHVDLPAVPVEGDAVTVSGEVGPGIVQYVVGSWTEKRPCTTGRHGCVAYGYELDGEVLVFPDDAYWGAEHGFADLQPMRVAVMDAGGGPELARKIRELLPTKKYPTVEGAKASAPRTQIEVLYRARWDRIRAWEIAATLHQAELGARWTVVHWPDAPEAFVVAVGAP
jgi:hypothetical protein